MDWRKADVLELISMYRESESLWNPLCEEYKDLKLRKSTWKDFADHFDKDVYEIKKKIKNLRCMFNYERKRVENADKSSEIEPRLYYYDEMTFLDPVIVMRPSTLLQQSDPLTEKKSKRSPRTTVEMSPQKKLSNDSNTPPVDQHTLQMADSVVAIADPVESSKEHTFCAMLCTELKLLNSEEVYDNVTTEIFTIVKNAKAIERQIIYQPEEDAKFGLKGT